MNLKKPELSIFLLPGGTMPKRQTPGAIGYDAYIRAVVSPSEMDKKNKNLRKLLFDFKRRPHDRKINKHVIRTNDGLVYRMRPGESVLVGIGFVTSMPFPMYYWITPRSGLSSKYGITVTNAPGTVDPDYRGEAGVLVFNRNKRKSFDLKKDMRIAQVIFQWALIPRIRKVSVFSNLPKSKRGAGGFGHTGH